MRKLDLVSLAAMGLLAFTVGCSQSVPTSRVNADEPRPIDDPMMLPQKLNPSQVIQVSADQLEGLQSSSGKYQTMRAGGRGFGGRGFGGRGFGGRGFGGRGFGGRGFGGLGWLGAGWGGALWGAGWGPQWWGASAYSPLALYPYGSYYYPYYFNSGVYSPFWSTPYTYAAGAYSPYYSGINPLAYTAPATAYPNYAQANVPLNQNTINIVAK